MVITGSAQGLGKAFAKRLLQDGARVKIDFEHFPKLIRRCRCQEFEHGVGDSFLLMVIKIRCMLLQVCLSDIQEPVGLATKTEFQV